MGLSKNTFMDVREREMNDIVPHTLYNIRLDHLALLQEIEENDGEITPEIENALSLTQEQFQEKAISYAFIIKKFEGNTDIIEKEIARLTALRDRAERKAELFKQRLSEAMQQFGVEKIETPLLKLSFRKSESVNVYNEAAIPADYLVRRTDVTIAKSKIKEALKIGCAVPGAELVTKQNLQLR